MNNPRIIDLLFSFLKSHPLVTVTILPVCTDEVPIWFAALRQYSSVVVDLLLIFAPIICGGPVFGTCFVIRYFVPI